MVGLRFGGEAMATLGSAPSDSGLGGTSPLFFHHAQSANFSLSGDGGHRFFGGYSLYSSRSLSHRTWARPGAALARVDVGLMGNHV